MYAATLSSGDERGDIVAFSDPQQLTFDTTEVSMVRTGLSLNEGQFRDETGDVILTILHDGSSSSRNRHIVRVNKTLTITDPYVPTSTRPVKIQAHIVLDAPKVGVSVDDVSVLADALCSWLDKPTLRRVLAGES